MSVFKITDIKHPAYADSSVVLFEDGAVSIPGLLLDEHSLGDLSDVDTAGKQNESVLAFDAGQGKWRPAAVPSLVTGVPTGTISMFGGATAPAGWLNCDGAAVSRTIFSDLFAIVGTTYGAGDGAATFNLPDLRLRFPRGVGSGVPLGSSADTNSHDHTVSEEHSHLVTTVVASGNHAHTHGSGNYGGNAVAVGNHTHRTNTNTTGGGTSGNGIVANATNSGRVSGNIATVTLSHQHNTPDHNHTINEGGDGGHGHNLNFSGNSGSASLTTHDHTATSTTDPHSQSVTSGSADHVPAYTAVNYIIKT